MKTHRILAGAIALSLAAVVLPAPATYAQAPAAPPPTSGDGKEHQAIMGLVNEGKWTEAMKAGEKFLEKYKDLSPFSREVRYYLAVAYLQQGKMQDDAVRELKKLLADAKAPPEMREPVMMLIAKAYTMKGVSLGEPGTAAQRKVRDDIYNDAIKGYDAYLAAFPQSKSADTAFYLSGILALEVKRYEDAVKRFGTVYQTYTKSLLRNDAMLNIGKAFLVQANDLMTAIEGKDPKPEDVAKGLEILEKNALPALSQVFRDSSDLAIINEAQGYIGQIRLTQSQHIDSADEKDPEKRKARQAEFLNPALDAFRAVRSIEEVVAAQEFKIKQYTDALLRLVPGTPDYMGNKTWLEGLVGVETEKRDRLKTGSDQYLSARVAIARILLFLQKYDECRVLIRYLMGQKELFAKEKDQEAAVNALLTHTYIGQANLPKALETFESFRAGFKGHERGEDLPLFLANLAVEKREAAKAEEIIKQAMEDYGADWSFAKQAVRVQIGVAFENKDFDKALSLCDQVLSASPTPDVEVETLSIKGGVLERMAVEKSSPALQDQAFATYDLIRQKFATHAKAEEAWFKQCEILAGKGDRKKAVEELTKFYDGFSGASAAKSEYTKNNVVTALYLLGKMQDAAQDLDKAVGTYKKLIDLYPQNEVAQDAFFRIQDIEKDKRKNAAGRKKIMEEYIAKYPEHKNVYYAFINIADVLLSGALNAKPGPDGKPGTAQTTMADREAGVKKLVEFVDYELEKKLTPPKGEGALIMAADAWYRPLTQAPLNNSYDLLTKEQQLDAQKCFNGVLAIVQKHLQSYPAGERVPEILDKAVNVQEKMLKDRQIDLQKGAAYFDDLNAKYGKDKQTKSKILMALATFVGDKDARRGQQARAEAYALMPEPATKEDPETKEMRAIPTFTPGDWDRILTDLFEAKKYDEMTKVIARVRKEFPEGDGNWLTPQGQALGLFWEGKILAEQGKTADAAPKFEELRKRFPKTPKIMEADYGVIVGQNDSGALKTEAEKRAAVKRLLEITAVTTGKKFDLQANALLLAGRIQEDLKDYDAAIAAYAKVADRFASVPTAAGDGLWRAAQLLDRQANNQLPVKTKAEKEDEAKKRAAEKIAADKAAAEKAAAGKPADAKPAEAKPGEAKPGPKPDDKKPAAPKPGDKTTAQK